MEVWNASCCMNLHTGRMSRRNKHQNIDDSFTFFRKLSLNVPKHRIIYVQIWTFCHFETRFSKKVKLSLMFWYLFLQNMRQVYRFMQHEAFQTSTSPPISPANYDIFIENMSFLDFWDAIFQNWNLLSMFWCLFPWNVRLMYRFMQ